MVPNRILEKLFLFFSFFPFISLYPIDTDVQPCFIVFAVLVIIKNTIINNIKIKRIYVLLLLYFTLLCLKINFSPIDYIFYFSRAISPLIGLLTLLAFCYSLKDLNYKLFRIVVNIYFWFSIFTFIAPDLFLNIQAHLVRNVNTVDIYGLRGISTFSTEPGLFAGLLICFLLINDFLFNNKLQSQKIFKTNFLYIFIMLILTKSGTGYLLFFIYIIFRFIHNKNFFLLIIISIFMVPLIICILKYLNSIFVSRGLDILVKLIFEPQLLLTLDMSILTRIHNFYLGLLSIFYYPFGYGINNINDIVYEIIIDNEFLYNFPKVQYMDFSQKISLASSFSMLTVMYGLFWWIAWFLIFFIISKASLMSKFFATIFIFFSYSAAFPLIWILLGLKKDR